MPITKIYLRQDGQSILEVLIALALIILFLSGIVVVELIALKNVEFGQNKSISTRLAQQQLERARVLRDSVGIDELSTKCSGSCYINSELTPFPNLTPTCTFGQSLTISLSNSDCPSTNATITPIPVSYKAKATVSWGRGAVSMLTPAPQVEVSTCFSDWR